MLLLVTYNVFFLHPACIPNLHTIQISHCRLKTAADIEHLIECETVSVVDLSHNKLDDPEIVDVFAKMKNLVSGFVTSSVVTVIICLFVFREYPNINQNFAVKIMRMMNNVKSI